ncbi:GntR family transcriptional regulator [Nocardia sp. NPDC055321]
MAELTDLDVPASRTVNELRATIEIGESTIRRALARLTRDGLVSHTNQGPARYRSTDRGDLAFRRSGWTKHRNLGTVRGVSP